MRFEGKSLSLEDAHDKENKDQSRKYKHHFKTVVIFLQPEMRCIKMKVRRSILITNEYVCFDIDLVLTFLLELATQNDSKQFINKAYIQMKTADFIITL